MGNKVVFWGVICLALVFATAFFDDISKWALLYKKDISRPRDANQTVKLADASVGVAGDVKASNGAAQEENVVTVSSPATSQTRIMKWVDANGKVHYGDTSQSVQHADAKPVDVDRRVNVVNIAPVKGTPEQQAIIERGRMMRDREQEKVRLQRANNHAHDSDGVVALSEDPALDRPAAAHPRDGASCEEYRKSTACYGRFKQDMVDGRRVGPGYVAVCGQAVTRPEGCN